MFKAAFQLPTGIMINKAKSHPAADSAGTTHHIWDNRLDVHGGQDRV